jgi:AcrR family transcriptional regulator
MEPKERMAADDVRSLLVAALVELLKHQSVETISVRDVARAAGVNHGLVHRYFGSKAQLVEAAVEQLSAEIHRGSPDHPAMSAATFAYFRAHPEIAAFVARACLDGPRALLAHAAPPRARLAAIVAPISAALEKMGMAGQIDPHLVNALASAALLGWFVFQPLLASGFGLPADADEQLARLLALVDQLLLASSGPRKA